ncbi:efflux RND transporter periplasmic adaptor subunit [Arcticibacter sp. MXS-1]|uniref:efflux RND transporter periplasmic adaptor subunit n=1 Tax=Arcticibacter sp. MXS-1 TaxID=3341726 RepID=UPI0035A84B51
MSKRIILSGIVAAIAMLGLSCSNTQEGNNSIQDDIIPVKLQALEQGSSGSTIKASGAFTTDDETVLSFKTGGVINRMLVKEGDPVTRGQLLATLNLTEVNAGAEQAVLAKEKAERDYQRAYRLYKDSVATLEQMQNARTALDVARQQLKAASFNKNYSEIRAAASGYVLQRFANEGQVVGPGTPVLQVNGAGSSNWLVKVGVSDKQWASIRKGDPATVQSDALPGQQLPAQVYKKSEGIDPSSGTFIIQLRLSSSAPSAVASGMFARAEIRPRRKTAGTWAIPYDALLDGDAGKGYVFVSNDGKTAQRKEVRIGDIRRDKVLITGGLENCRYLIISGSPYLNDGSRIKVK